MSSILISATVFGCAFGGAVIGMFLQRFLPRGRVDKESKDVIKMGTGLVATMAALILGLLVGAAKETFDSQTNGFRLLSTNLILLDRMLSQYGPEAQPIRHSLREAVESIVEHLWPASGLRSIGWSDSSISSNSSVVFDAIRRLEPHDELHRSIQTQALQIGAELARTRWQLSQLDEETLPMPFLIVLSFWLFFLFVVFGLFSPKNVVVVTVLLVSALSVAGAVFLVVDLDQPFEGFLRISSTPLRHALAQFGR